MTLKKNPTTGKRTAISKGRRKAGSKPLDRPPASGKVEFAGFHLSADAASILQAHARKKKLSERKLVSHIIEAWVRKGRAHE
jgi:hypothetical protein